MNFEHIRSPLRVVALPAGEFMLFSEPTPLLNPAFNSNRLLQCNATGLGARAPFFMLLESAVNDGNISLTHHEIHFQGGETLSIIR
ncbi:hypothetical protein EON80_15070 [bacterium]|nr:MAG: hypothetical protein EON80_15070 [bacterium]